MLLSIIIPSRTEPNIQDMVDITEKHFPNAHQIIVANDREGHGKGWAVRQALQHATGDVICFIDGDMDIHPRMIKRLIPFLDDYDCVVGRKQIRGLLSRRILTRLSRLYIHTLFDINIDTQTGLKLFNRHILEDWKSDKFMFDLEILAKLRQKRIDIIEVPVEVTPVGASSKRMGVKNVYNCLIESFMIWLGLRLR